jgi:tRNA pseudouridine55 synthase
MLPYVKPGDRPDFRDGALLLVDKPQGWTSFDVVNKLRGALRSVTGHKNFKVGHAGTLDPMATGLLLVCTGGWTKKLHELQGLDKRYEAAITLGVTTDTYDAEGRVVDTHDVPVFTHHVLEDALRPFIGAYDQHPPAFSAIKKDGKPLYALARAGHDVKTEPRRVIVYDMRITAVDLPVVQLSVHCGSGFYVRSLAHDLGRALGCGAHLSGLRRTMIGAYDVRDALSVQDTVALITAG